MSTNFDVSEKNIIEKGKIQKLYLYITDAKNLLRSFGTFFHHLPEYCEILIPRIDNLINSFISDFDLLIDTYRNLDISKADSSEVLNNILIEIDKLNIGMKDSINEFDILHQKVLQALDKNRSDLQHNVVKNLINIQDFLDSYLDSISNLRKQSQGIYLSQVIQKANNEVLNLKSAKNALEGTPAETIYKTAYDAYNESANKFETVFWVVLIIGLVFAFVLYYWIPYDSQEVVKSILFRVFITSIFVITITFSLRRASHYRKLAHQAHQTSLELEALPLFTRILSDEAKEEVYKKLAEKYFGKDIDQTQNDKIADIVQDQAKMSIDMAKATTEMVKSFKDIKPESKPQNNTQQN